MDFGFTLPISDLLLGDAGWLESAAFVTSGLLIVAFAVGLRAALREGRGARRGPILIGVAGLGLAVAVILSRRFRSAWAAPWALYSLASGVAMLVAFVLYVVGTREATVSA